MAHVLVQNGAMNAVTHTCADPESFVRWGPT